MAILQSNSYARLSKTFTTRLKRLKGIKRIVAKETTMMKTKLLFQIPALNLTKTVSFSNFLLTHGVSLD